MKLPRTALLVLALMALVSWGVRELFPKTDDAESRRLQAALAVAEDSSRVRNDRANALLDTLEATRASFEADTAAHVAQTVVAIESAEEIGARLRATLDAEQQQQLDSLTKHYDTALAASEAGRISNADRLRSVERALLVMTLARDTETARADTATALARENWDLYQKEKRRGLFNLFDVQCTVGPSLIATTDGAVRPGVGVTCGIGR